MLDAIVRVTRTSPLSRYNLPKQPFQQAKKQKKDSFQTILKRTLEQPPESPASFVVDLSPKTILTPADK